MTLTVAQAPPNVTVPTFWGPTPERRERALAKLGLTPTATTVVRHRNPQYDGEVLSQQPKAGTSVRAGDERCRSSSSATSHRRRPGPSAPDRAERPFDRAQRRERPDRRDLMRVAVLGGGRSSEHEVSLASAASVREGLRAGGHEVVAGRDRARRSLAARRRASSRSPRQAGCWAPTSPSPRCTAPSARTASSRGCWSALTCPTSAAASPRRRCAWTRSASRQLMGAAGLPQVGLRGVSDAALARRSRARSLADARPARAAGLRQAGAPGLLGRHREGARARASSPPRSTPRSRTTRWRSSRPPPPASRSSARCSATRSRARRRRARSSLHSEFYDYAAKYEPGGMELIVPARIGEQALARGRADRGRRLHAGRLRAAWRASTSSSRATACCSTS